MDIAFLALFKLCVSRPVWDAFGTVIPTECSRLVLQVLEQRNDEEKRYKETQSYVRTRTQDFVEKHT